MHEGTAIPDPCWTSFGVAAPAGSIAWEAQEVFPPEEPKDLLKMTQLPARVVEHSTKKKLLCGKDLTWMT